MIRGWKLLRDGASLGSGYGRVQYPLDGTWIDVPGNGAYVAHTGWLLSGGGDIERDQLVELECEQPTGAEAPVGMACYARVRVVRVFADCDQAALSAIAREDAEPSVRLAAAMRIEDQDVLAKVALGDADWYIRRCAVERLDDQAVIEQVAQRDAAWDVRLAAVARVADQDVLTTIALEDGYFAVRHAAVARLAALKEKS